MAQRAEHPAKGWAGTYGRLSMLPRFTQTHSPENQDRLNKQAALTHGLKIKPGYEFYDEESAYRNVRRRDFERAIAALLNQEIEALIVPKLDRLSRRGMGQVGLLLDDLERVGGRIISVGDGLDSSQPGARQIIAFLAEQARTEVLNTAWRVEQFHEGARRAGQWVRKPPYGYLVENGKLKPHPVQAPIVRRIIDDFLNGATLRSIAVALNRDKLPNPTTARILEAKQAGRTLKGREDGSWGYTTVRRVLVNPALCGWQTHEGRVVLGDDGEPVSFGGAHRAGRACPHPHRDGTAHCAGSTCEGRRPNRQQDGWRSPGEVPADRLCPVCVLRLCLHHVRAEEPSALQVLLLRPCQRPHLCQPGLGSHGRRRR